MALLLLEIPRPLLPRVSPALPLSGSPVLSFLHMKAIEIKLKSFSPLSPYLLWRSHNTDDCAARYL